MSLLAELFHVILTSPEVFATMTGAVPVVVNTSDEVVVYPTVIDIEAGPEIPGGVAGLTVKVNVCVALPAALPAVRTTG